MERFAKIVDVFQSLIIFAKHSVLAFWHGSEYASELHNEIYNTTQHSIKQNNKAHNVFHNKKLLKNCFFFAFLYFYTSEKQSLYPQSSIQATSRKLRLLTC